MQYAAFYKQWMQIAMKNVPSDLITNADRAPFC
jgi:hypothetical protein